MAPSTPQITVYTRPVCLFCTQVKDLLTEAKVPFKEVYVETPVEQQRCKAQFGTTTFPIVVANGVFLGGYSQVVQLHADNKLQHYATSAST